VGSSVLPDARHLPALLKLRAAVLAAKQAYMAMATQGSKDSPRPVGPAAEYIQALERVALVAAESLREMGIETGGRL